MHTQISVSPCRSKVSLPARCIFFPAMFAAIIIFVSNNLSAQSNSINIGVEISDAENYPASAQWIALATSSVARLNIKLEKTIRWSADVSTESEKFLDVRLFDSTKMPNSSKNTLANNCLYISEYDKITCDVNMIRNLVVLYELDKKEISVSDGHIVQRHIVENDEEIIKTAYKMLIGWVLGHEFGHAYHHHSGNFAYLPIDLGGSSMPDTPDIELKKKYNYSKCHKMEEEADNFFESAISGKDVNEEYYSFLIDLLNRDSRRAACPATSVSGYCKHVYPGTGLAFTSRVVVVQDSKTHPAFLIRILDLLDRLHNSDRKGGFHIQVESFRRGGVELKKKFYSHGSC